MKALAFASILALFLISLTSPWASNAQTTSRSASGTYRFVLDDDPQSLLNLTLARTNVVRPLAA